MRTVLENELASVSNERSELLARVAELYYEQGMTQQRISTILGYSRSAISRFLSEAREGGIVEIRINYPILRDTSLEQTLANHFDLQGVRVLVRGVLSYEKMLRRIGRLAARLVEQSVSEDTCLGVSWGTAVFEVAHALDPQPHPRMTIVPLIGALGTEDAQIDGPELARWFAHMFGARCRTLPAPLIVNNQQVRDALISDPHIADTLQLAAHVDIAVVGIGSVNPELSSLVRAGYISSEEIREIAATGAEGDVCAIHFDIHGNILDDLAIARRTIGLRAERLQSIPQVIGVAGGKIKAPAILGALRAGLINHLVTDDVAARGVLRLAASDDVQSLS